MQIKFTPKGWEHYLYWQSTDKAIVKRINMLLKDIKRSPFDGLSKPEPLKQNLSGLWSRRITEEHRLVYNIENDTIRITLCRFYY